MILNDLGYDKFLNKSSERPKEIGGDDVDYLLEAISGNKITEGVAQSTNKRLNIDFDDGNIQVKEGDLVRAEIGKFVDDKIGLRVYNNGGDTIVDSTA